MTSSHRQVFQMCQMQLQIHSTPRPCSSYLAKLLPFPAKKTTTAGMPRRASVTGDRRSRIHRQVAMYHSSHRTAQSPFSGSWAVPSIEVWPSQNHSWSTSATFAFADDAGVRDRTLRQMAMMFVSVIGCQPILQNKERKLP